MTVKMQENALVLIFCFDFYVNYFFDVKKENPSQNIKQKYLKGAA
jgi:hypothetical protein